jgi:integrase
LTTDQIIAARKAAHADGRPCHALAYALAFETTLRLWDVIGQWFPLSWPEMSDVIDAGRKQKWLGLRWENIDADMVLRFVPSKTEESTGAAVTYPLSKAPMVIEELAHWPEEVRRGPVVVGPSGRPFRHRTFGDGWRKDRKTAGIASTAWLRDLRASGITEGRAGNVSLDDAAKVAGHSGKKTTGRVYDRAVLEAADRFAEARLRGRKQSGNGSGNER